MDPNLQALQDVVAKAIALLDALFAAYTAEVAKNADLTAQIAALQAGGAGDSSALPALTQSLTDAITRDTPAPPAPPSPPPATAGAGSSSGSGSGS